MIMLSGEGFAVTLAALDLPMDDEYLALNGNIPLTQCSNKFKPILETRNLRSIGGSYYDRNPRSFESDQIRVATKRWRKLARYDGSTTFDEFESIARSRIPALLDRWYW
jgi:hypothetical protein